jgi:hypothetical protein
MHKRHSRCTHARGQEREASARRGFANRVCKGNAPDFRKQVRIPRTHHGGLTPPALALRCERLPEKNDICDAQTHAHRSGKRQPAVGGETRLRRHERDCPQDRRRCVCVCVDDRCIRVIKHHGGLTPPALVSRVPQIGCRRWWASLAAGQVHSVARRAFQRFQASSRALRSAAGPFGSSPWRMKPWPAPG